MKETLADIAWAINKHTITEHQNMPCQGGVARYRVDLEEKPRIHQVFLANVPVRKQVSYGDDSINIYKNTKLGGTLIMKGIGDSIYKGKKLKVYNKATYQHWITGSITEVEIQQEDLKKYKFSDLKSLLNQVQTAKNQEEENKRRLRQLEKEREEIELLQKKAAEEEALRLQKEREENEKRVRECQDKAKLYDKEIAETNAKIKYIKSFVRKDLTLRAQHILDPSQEEAKRSHLYDGVPVLIDGGPGTGKTTTMIQRLKFLLSDVALRDNTEMSENDIVELTNPDSINTKWIFFSPNTLLLEYLRNNMREEEMIANDGNTFTLEQFRKKMLLAYRLRNPETNLPFKNFSFSRNESSQPLIQNAAQTIQDFESFCIDNIKSILLQAYSLPTANYEWHSKAVKIKADCKKAENIKDMAALVNLFYSLQDNQNDQVRDIEQQLDNLLGVVSVETQQEILKDETTLSTIKALLEKWDRESTPQNEEDVLETDMAEDAENEEGSVKLNFEADLYKRLKDLIRTESVIQIDKKKKLSGQQAELYSVVSKHINEESLKKVSSLAWFVKNYASLTKGIESNIFSQIPRLYKLFRKKQLENSSSNYDLVLLKKIIEKENNKHLHADEQSLLIGFINNMLYQIYKRSSVRFNKLKHRYALAYKEWCKPVIGVDEATDFSILDYYLIYSFRHYKFNSITLCGDIMQGITENGITDWNDLKWIMPKLTNKELKVSYRQTPTLVKLAREMYKDEEGRYPSYQSDKELDEENEPAPIACVSEDEDEKAEWIAKRIIEVYKIYDMKMPSVAIFVGDEVNVPQFINTIYDTDLLNGIDVEDCTGGRALNRSDIVRVFRISEVKGMEFEVAFFYNLDEALHGNTTGLMKKYLYVGLSRATTHLAATFCNPNDARDVLNYFETQDNNWKL